MGSCFSSATKVGGSSSGSAGHRDPAAAQTPPDGGPQQKPREAQRNSSQHPRQRDRHRRRPSGSVPYGKRTDFGYAKDFESRYSIGKLLGHGQFGYTFVATDKANGDRVAVKRIDKNKVVLLSWIAFSFMDRFHFFFFFSLFLLDPCGLGWRNLLLFLVPGICMWISD